jgi:hypothetical protein
VVWVLYFALVLLYLLLHLQLHAFSPVCISTPAGTDANVSCVLHGELGMTPSLRLDSSANNFERGTRDEFSVMSADVGRFTQLTIGHDNK